MEYSAFSDVLNGPHFPIRVQRKHAALAVQILDWFAEEMEGDEFAFDQEHDHTDVQTARESFREVATDDPVEDIDPWLTVPLTPLEHEALQDAHVSYELDGPGSREVEDEEWEPLTSEIQRWHDADPVDGDISEDELRDALADLAEQYQDWEEVPPADRSVAMVEADRETSGGKFSGSVAVYESAEPYGGFLATAKFERLLGGSTEVDMSDTIGEHPHRHAALRTIRQFFDHAADVAPQYVEEIEEEPDGPDRDTTPKVEFASMEDADEARDRWSEYRCPIDDDKREKRVAWVSDIPEDVLAEIEEMAEIGKGQTESGPGQVELTEGEKDRLGPFKGSNNYRKAAAVKGLLLDNSISDWESYYDPELTVDEHRSKVEDWRQDQSGADVRDGPSTQDRQEDARAAERAEHQECKHAEDICSNGDPEACEFLKEECGYEEDVVEDLLAEGMDEDARHVEDDADQTEQQELVTVGGGEYPEMEVRPEVAGALRRSWSGYKSALGELSDAIETAEQAKGNAQQAMAAINAIRSNHGQEEIEPHGLEDRLDSLENLPDATTLREFGVSPSYPEGSDAEDTAPEGDNGRNPPLDVGAEEMHGVRDSIESHRQREHDNADLWNPTADGYSATGTNGARIVREPKEVGVYNIVLVPPKDGEPVVAARNLGHEESKRAVNRLANSISPVDIYNAGAELYRKVREAGVEPDEEIRPSSRPRLDTDPEQSRQIRKGITDDRRGVDVPDIPQDMGAGPIAPSDQEGVGVDKPGTNRAKADYDRPDRMEQFSEMAAEGHKRMRANRLRRGDRHAAEDLRTMQENVRESGASTDSRTVTLTDPEGSSVTVEIPETVAGWEYDPDAPVITGEIVYANPTHSDHQISVSRVGGQSYIVQEHKQSTTSTLDTLPTPDAAIEEARRHMENTPAEGNGNGGDRGDGGAPVTVAMTAVGGSDMADAIESSAAVLGYEALQTEPNGNVEFVDYPFTSDRPQEEKVDALLDAVDRHEPRIAVAPDIDGSTSLEDAVEIGDQLLAAGADNVVLVPKSVRPENVPDRFRVGLPAANWGDEKNEAFAVWEYEKVSGVHILGGSPDAQLEIGNHGVPVESVDGSAVEIGARHFEVWTPGSPSWEYAGATSDLYDRVRYSLNNVALSWADLYDQAHPEVGEYVTGEQLVPEEDPADFSVVDISDVPERRQHYALLRSVDVPKEAAQQALTEFDGDAYQAAAYATTISAPGKNARILRSGAKPDEGGRLLNIEGIGRNLFRSIATLSPTKLENYDRDVRVRFTTDGPESNLSQFEVHDPEMPQGFAVRNGGDEWALVYFATEEPKEEMVLERGTQAEMTELAKDEGLDMLGIEPEESDHVATRRPPLDVTGEELRTVRGAIEESRSDTPPWDVETVRDIALGGEKAARAAVEKFDGWEHFAEHVDARLSTPAGLGSFGASVDGLTTSAKNRLTGAMTPTVARRILHTAGMEDAVEMHEQSGNLASETAPDQVGLDEVDRADRDAAIEQDKQQSLGGGRASDQARFTVDADRGESDGEVESTPEQNEGGLMADTREETDSTEETEQEIPEEFRVAEGGQDTL